MIKDHLGKEVVWTDDSTDPRVLPFLASVRECMKLAAVESVAHFLWVMAQDQEAPDENCETCYGNTHFCPDCMNEDELRFCGLIE